MRQQVDEQQVHGRGTQGGDAGDTRATRAVLDLPLPALPRAAADARRALRRLVAGTPYEARVEDASLALSEIVSNAVLHGREPLALRGEVDARRLRLEVRDGSPLSPSFSMLDATAVTGRGLLLVANLVDRWGLEPCEAGKAVWFELDPDAAPPAELGVDALLAAWGEDVDDPAQEVVKVVLTDLDVDLTARAEAHVEALLRELALVQAGDEAHDELALVAERVLLAAGAVEALRAEVKHQLSRAVVDGRTSVDVTLRITRIDADTVRDFARALDEADRLSRQGHLLTEPAPRQLSAARERYLNRIISQLTV